MDALLLEYLPILIFMGIAAAMGIGRFVYTPILPFMTDGLQLPPDDAGLIASANFLGYLAGALAGASRSLPGNPRLWFLGGLLASALTSAAMALTTSLSVFLLIRFASGVASAFALVFSTSLILERLTAAGRGGLSSYHPWVDRGGSSSVGHLPRGNKERNHRPFPTPILHAPRNFILRSGSPSL